MEKAGRARKTLEVMNGDVTNSRDRAGAFRPQVSRKTVTIPMHIPQKRQNRRMAFIAALFLSLEPFNVERLNRVRHGVKPGLSGKPPHDGTVQPSHCFNPILTVG